MENNNKMPRYKVIMKRIFTIFILWIFYMYRFRNNDNFWFFKILPTTLLVYYGCYILFTFGNNISKIIDKKEDMEDLKKEIEEAKLYYKNNNLLNN